MASLVCISFLLRQSGHEPVSEDVGVPQAHLRCNSRPFDGKNVEEETSLCDAVVCANMLVVHLFEGFSFSFWLVLEIK